MSSDDTQKIRWIKVGDHSLPEPKRSTRGSSGHDLMSREDIDVPAGQRRMVRTGWSIEMPLGIEAQVRSRSGLAAKHGISVLNSPGTIDSDYTGEVCVILMNHSDQDFTVSEGQRIAQLVFAPVVLFGESDETIRGSGGFGSTGT